MSPGGGILNEAYMNEKVRIGAALLVSVMVGIYGLAYNGSLLSIVTGCDFSGIRTQELPDLTRFALIFDAWWFLLATILAGVAVWCHSRGNRLGLQIALSATWLLSLAWVLCIHIVWMLPMLPLCSPVQ
jgi:hypothetical protein